jgi:hypothetical protein
MITLRRAAERHHDRLGEQEVWHTFDRADRADPLADGFAALQALDENSLSPGAGILRQPRREAEIVTYVREGALAQEDSRGRSGVLQAGEFQRLSAGRGVRSGERNASLTDWAHVFQAWLGPSGAGHEPGLEQKRFSTAQRRSGLCVVASPDGRRGSLRLDQGALVYSTLLSPGQHLVHELESARSAWLHVVHGELILGGSVLTAGDSAGITGERAVSLTAREETEILLFDLGELPPTVPFETETAP